MWFGISVILVAQQIQARFGLGSDCVRVWLRFQAKFEMCFVGQGVEFTHPAPIVLER
jgi:hypothetical protein